MKNFISKFATSSTNDWGEVVYTPTTLGIVVLSILILLLLIAGITLAKKAARKLRLTEAGREKPISPVMSVKQLAICALAIALGTILSNVKVFSFPTGGSITLFSMLVICLPGYFCGLGCGILTGIAYGLLQLIIDPYVLYPMQLVVDYILAFGALGLAGIFHKMKNIIPSYVIAILGRYFFAVISGWIFFGSYAWEGWSALPYSLAYNAIYIFAEAAITIAILCIPQVRNVFTKIKTMINE